VQYTKEEVDGVRRCSVHWYMMMWLIFERIVATKTHYETLSIGKDAAEDEIKRAYKKVVMYLSVHI
jgi:preprotein translocase subunit Sec63